MAHTLYCGVLTRHCINEQIYWDAHIHTHTHTISLLYLIELGQFSLSLSLQTLNNQLPSQGAPADERPSDYSGSWRGPLSWSKLTGASQSVRQRLVDGYLHLYWTMTSWLLCTILPHGLAVLTLPGWIGKDITFMLSGLFIISIWPLICDHTHHIHTECPGVTCPCGVMEQITDWSRTDLWILIAYPWL